MRHSWGNWNKKTFFGHSWFGKGRVTTFGKRDINQTRYSFTYKCWTMLSIIFWIAQHNCFIYKMSENSEPHFPCWKLQVPRFLWPTVQNTETFSLQKVEKVINPHIRGTASSEWFAFLIYKGLQLHRSTIINHWRFTSYLLLCYKKEKVLRQQFWEGPFLFQHVHKASSIKKLFLQLGAEGLNWPAESWTQPHPAPTGLTETQTVS